MAKPEWGAKHTCQHCGAKYYDLLRSPAVCPKCGTEFNPDALLRSRRVKPVAPERIAVAAEASGKTVDETQDDAEKEDEELTALSADDDDLDELADAEDEDDELIEDASELGEDDEDMAEVRVSDDEREDT